MDRQRRDRNPGRSRDRRPRRSSKNSNNDFRGGFGRRDSKPKEMHTVVCDKCGEECQVPFKPSTDKPVYCDACFEKKGGSRGQKDYSEDLKEINKKLDKILKIIMD